MARDPHRARSLIIILIVGFLIVGYAFNRSYSLLEGPVIHVASPSRGETITEAVIAVAGTARNIARLTLNGRSISVNDKGEFSEPLIVPEGYTVMTITAEDKFGKRREFEFPLYRERTASSTIQAS